MYKCSHVRPAIWCVNRGESCESCESCIVRYQVIAFRPSVREDERLFRLWWRDYRRISSLHQLYSPLTVLPSAGMRSCLSGRNSKTHLNLYFSRETLNYCLSVWEKFLMFLFRRRDTKGFNENFAKQKMTPMRHRWNEFEMSFCRAEEEKQDGNYIFRYHYTSIRLHSRLSAKFGK